MSSILSQTGYRVQCPGSPDEVSGMVELVGSLLEYFGFKQPIVSYFEGCGEGSWK